MRLAPTCLALVLLAPPTAAHAKKSCAWVTVDDFVAPDTLGASAAAVYAEKKTVYVAGTSFDSTSSGAWVVRAWSGGAWSTIDSYVHTPGVRNHPEAIVGDGRGRLIVAGGANNPSNAGPWLVRASADGGATWSLADEFGDVRLPAGFARGAALAASGELYVSGYSHDADDRSYHWYVRRSLDGGASWSTIDDYAPISSATAGGAMAIDPAGDVYVSGYNWDGRQYRWQVRRLPAGSASWSTVDDFVVLPSDGTQSFGAQPAGAVSLGPGHVLVAGTYVDAAGRSHWEVRGTDDAGAHWSTVDDFSPGCGVRGMAYDSKDEAIYVVGRCFDGVAYKWVTRRSADAGASWSTEDWFGLNSAATSYPNAVGVSPHGDVYVVGHGNDGTRNHWLVRTRQCGRK